MQSAPKVFITGASSGIGSALARHYAKQGAFLGLAARRGEQLQALVEALTSAGATQVHCYPLDVTDAAALRSAAEDFIARQGVPDIVIANAGVSVGTLTECAEDLEVIKRIIEINVYGMAATFSPFIAAMRQSRKGRQTGTPGRHRLGRRHSRPARRRSLQRLESGGDHLPRKSAS